MFNQAIISFIIKVTVFANYLFLNIKLVASTCNTMKPRLSELIVELGALNNQKFG